SAEAASMAAVFNEMSTNLRHWYEEAKDKTERLQASYDRFYSVTQSARDAIVSTDDRGAIIFWSRSATVLFGHDEDAALGRPLVQFIAEPYRQTYLEMVTPESVAGENPLAF